MLSNALSQDVAGVAAARESKIRSLWSGPSLIASSQAHKEQVFRFRYQMYSRKQGRYLLNARDSKAGVEGMVIDSSDDYGLHLYSLRAGQINGAISICFGPFPEYLQQRIQLDVIRAELADLGPEDMAYVSRLVVDSRCPESKQTAIQLLDDAYWVCTLCGVEVAFAHGVKATVRHFSRWGFLPYGEPFDLEFPKKQFPIVSVPGNRAFIVHVNPRLLTDRRWRDASARALGAFNQITGWVPALTDNVPTDMNHRNWA